MQHAGYALVATALILIACSAHAMVVIPATTSEMVKVSDWVVRARVESETVGWNDAQTMVYTSTTVRVTECYGPKPENCPATLVICQPGGRVGNGVCVVPGMPRYRPGEEVILFLERKSIKRFAKHSAEYMPVGGPLGKYTLTENSLAVRDLMNVDFVGNAKPRAGTTVDELVQDIQNAFLRMHEEGQR